MLQHPHALWDDGPSCQFIETELEFHYRVLLQLSNGSTVEQSAGQAGFQPAAAVAGTLQEGQALRQDVTLQTRRPKPRGGEGEQEEKYQYDPAPECVRSF